MKFEHSIEILHEPSGLFPWVAEPEKAMQWQKGVRSSKIIHETANKIGTTFHETMEENGNTLEMKGRITNYITDELVSFYMESRIHRVQADFMVIGSGHSSIFTGRWNISWKFPMNIMTLFIGNKIRKNILRQTQLEFAELKRLCEQQESSI